MRQKSRLLLKIFLLFVACLLLLFFKNFERSINRNIEEIYSIAAGTDKPDTNIVIIHISADDIERVGPWPIKRSYYALLINSLTKLDVKNIGVEVFLSSRLVTQTIYDKLLQNEIEKSGKVVLSSLAGGIIKHDNNFYTDSLSYPSPKLLNESFITGHLNYITDDGVVIPFEIINQGITEEAFSTKLSSVKHPLKSILINFHSSWRQFRNYSLIEYFDLVNNENKLLKSLKDKIVIIGISDPQFASTIKTNFDEQLPGIALHAFSLDNLLNSTWLVTSYYFFSAIILVLFVLFFIVFLYRIKLKRFFIYLITLLIFVLITFVCFSYFNLKIAHAFFILPFLLVALAELVYYFLDKKLLLKGALDESEILKSLLVKKKNELAQMQQELDVSEDDGSVQIIDKIKKLKSDIEKLNEDEEDRTRSEITEIKKAEIFFGIVYSSEVMAKTVDLIRKAAPTDTTILIVGESGTGKELAARAIHLLSSRKDKNFIAVNCGALSENLLESELFGHVRGAFTGASADKAGRFETADDGTLLLDEIGEPSENFQVKMLRVLQSGEIEKVGSSTPHRVDVRVVAATNKELETAVAERKFREDLYYRLNVFRIDLPPLRERKEDIELLAAHFLSNEAEEISLSKAVSKALVDCDWKGNVRELESVIKRAVIFAKSDKRELIRLSDLPKEIVRGSKYNFEDLVLESLREKKFSHSSISETAKELGNVNRTLISENFRGIVFKTLCENNFEIERSASIIALTDNEIVLNKVRIKIETFVTNIKQDITNESIKDFSKVKLSFKSKYKNLPAKFHSYLDEIIKVNLAD
jgi:transcriptional regulator with GAF, ATPase, and Fis domain/CHASE2 domain-containing sensor protein